MPAFWDRFYHHGHRSDSVRTHLSPNLIHFAEPCYCPARSLELEFLFVRGPCSAELKQVQRPTLVGRSICSARQPWQGKESYGCQLPPDSWPRINERLDRASYLILVLVQSAKCTKELFQIIKGGVGPAVAFSVLISE